MTFADVSGGSSLRYFSLIVIKHGPVVNLSFVENFNLNHNGIIKMGKIPKGQNSKIHKSM